MSHDQEFDIAVSFAGEQREYVERTVEAAKAAGLRVFYDRDMTVEWWGRNFVVEQRKVYGSRTRYFVPFISTEYFSKPFPRDEFDSAMLTAVKQGDGYILPVLMGDVRVPAELLHPHVAYLKSDAYTPEQLAEVFCKKVGAAADSGQEPRDVTSVVQSALRLPMPRVPHDFDKYEQMRSAFDYLLKQFEHAAVQLQSAGFPSRVREAGKSFTFRVDRWGKNICTLGVSKRAGRFDPRLCFNTKIRIVRRNAAVATAVPFFDVQDGQPKLKLVDWSLLHDKHYPNVRPFSKEKLFRELWAHVVKKLEQA